MNEVRNMDKLDQLKPIADEMLGALHADDALKRRVRRAAQARGTRRRGALIPAVCCVALALVCAGAWGAGRTQDVVQIDTLMAGDGAPEAGGRLVAGIGDNASVRAAGQDSPSLFATGTSDIPLVALNGGVYRMLSEPLGVAEGLLDKALGEVREFTEQPSLASDDAMEEGLSNVVPAGGEVYAISGLDASTAVAARVDGILRVFQRVSYAGRGPGGQGLEDTFGVRGQAKTLELTDVGTLEGDAANAALDVLLDSAMLAAQDASGAGRYLTVTLQNGLKLQLGVSGDTLAGCGGWSCPEFFEAFEAAL